PRRILHAGTGAIADVQLDRAHRQLVAASEDQFVYLWDAATGELVRKLQGTGPLAGVRTSPDGSIMIGVGGISPAIWDRTTGAQIGQLVGHSDLVKDGDFIDDQLFVTIAGNHTVLVWDVAAGRPLTTFHDVD